MYTKKQKQEKKRIKKKKKLKSIITSSFSLSVLLVSKRSELLAYKVSLTWTIVTRIQRTQQESPAVKAQLGEHKD